MKAYIEKVEVESPYVPKNGTTFVRITIIVPVVSVKTIEKIRFLFVQKLPALISIGAWRGK